MTNLKQLIISVYQKATRKYLTTSLKFMLLGSSLLLINACKTTDPEPLDVDTPTENAIVYSKTDEQKSDQFSTPYGYIITKGVEGQQKKIVITSPFRTYDPQNGSFVDSEEGNSALLEFRIGDEDDDITGSYTIKTDSYGEVVLEDKFSDQIELELPVFTNPDNLYIRIEGGKIDIAADEDDKYVMTYEFTGIQERYNHEIHGFEDQKNIKITGRFEGRLTAEEDIIL